MTVAPHLDILAIHSAPDRRGRSPSDLADFMPQMLWCARPDGQVDYYNAQWYDFTGVAPGSTDGSAWAEVIHADDRQRVWGIWQKCLASGEAYNVEYRLRHSSGLYLWTLARALPVFDAHGRILRWVGTCTDIDDSKQREQQHELFSRELNHRIKNIFTVMGSLVALSSRDHPEAADFAQDLGERLNALGRAHDLAQPVAPDAHAPGGEAPSLHRLLGMIFAPHPAYDAGRMIVEGDDMVLGDHALTALSLLFHELTTNAVKHGALSADGTVKLSIQRSADQIRLIWRESGGPRLSGPPQTTGFGTRLADLSVRRQLGGSLQQHWHPHGLEIEASLPLARLS